MTASYKKLFKLLIDRDMKKKDLQQLAGISSSSMSKLTKGEFVNLELLAKICVALDVDIGDVVQIIPDNASVDATSRARADNGGDI